LVGTETALAAVIVIAGALFSFLTPHFLTLSNAVDLIEAYAVTTILAAGVFVVLVSGGIDISFAATASVAQYAAAYAATRHGVPAVSTIALACAVGIALGALNGLLTHYLRVVSIIVTIATSSIYYALLIYFTGGTEIYNLPDWWTERVVLFRHVTASGDVVRITFPILVMVVVVLVTHFLMARMRIGRQIYALGGNPEAASRIGINILGVQVFVYGYLGLLAGIAGMVQAHRVHQAVPTAMVGEELSVLAVAILGGASLVGGLGTTTGIVLGVMFLAMLQNGLNLLGVSSYFFGVVIGLAILVSVSATGFVERRMRRRPRVKAA
jgi:simple sugar transport system permease protein